MEEKKSILPYEVPKVTVTRFVVGDCITTSSDIDFGTEDEWSENIPGGGWT